MEKLCSGGRVMPSCTAEPHRIRPLGWKSGYFFWMAWAAVPIQLWALSNHG